MRTAPLILLALAACSDANSETASPAAPAQTTADGSRSYMVSGFTKVELAGSEDVTVSVGPAFSVRATGDAEALDRLEIEVRGSELHLGHREGNWSWGDRKSAKIAVTMPALDGATVAGSGNMTVDRANARKVSAAIAGSGNLVIQRAEVEEADLALAGSGDLRIAGTARRVSMSIAGSGDIDASALKSVDANVSIAGSGNGRIAATGQVKAAVMGSGDVEVTGTKSCSISKLGSGDVRCG